MSDPADQVRPQDRSRYTSETFDSAIAWGDVSDRRNSPLLGIARGVGFQERDVWLVPDKELVLPTSGDTCTLVSTSDEDKPGGSGVHSVIIVGLDEDFLRFTSPPVTLNGTTPVTTSFQLTRMENLVSITTGSRGTAAGNVTLTHDGTGKPLGRIDPGTNQNHNSHFTVPADEEAIPIQLGAHISSAAPRPERVVVLVRFEFQPFGTPRYQAREKVLFGGSPYSEYFPSPLISLGPLTNTRWRARKISGRGPVTVTVDTQLKFRKVN